MAANSNKNTSNTPRAQKTSYNPQKIEEKHQQAWIKTRLFSPKLDSAKKPYYNLMMFPYPSAEGLHVGNMYAFTGTDIWGRYMRMLGHDVFEPIGLDGFGIHSENYAIKIGQHPKKLSKITQKRFYEQLKKTGNAYDWTRTLETYDPAYYKWTQWLFVQMFKNGLAYRQKATVNWCPSCKTVLADEQVINDACERCSTKVELKKLEQWFFKITEYADKLLEGIEKIDWPEKIKIAQRNWIGRSEGSSINFQLPASSFQIPVYTTRPDTLYGATFLVLSPESEWVEKLTTTKQQQKVSEYIKKAQQKAGLPRRSSQRENISEAKTGVFTGSYAINPVNGEKIPIWVADYVAGGYGTGAIMAVPAHDQRDFEFAVKYNLPIVQVITSHQSPVTSHLTDAYVGDGLIINSGKWNGWKVPSDIGKVIDWLEDKKLGKKETNYHLRDWLISRQRYWGPPIPMIYCKSCAKEGKGEREDMPGWHTTPEDQLPVELPYVEDYRPRGTGESPLAQNEDFVNTKCPSCGAQARRETDVSDTFLDSAWYYLRYLATEFDDIPFPTGNSVAQRAERWLPTHMYIGGAEHSVLHLLYVRFVWKALQDWGYINKDKGNLSAQAGEPFPRFYGHGLIIKDGAKMSKSKGNVVNPDKYIDKYGADSLRCYLMFLGPFDQGGDFRDSGMEGMSKFINRVWNLVTDEPPVIQTQEDSKEVYRWIHKTIKRVTDDMEDLRFNRAIAGLMEYVNFLRDKVTSHQLPVTGHSLKCAEWDEAIKTLLLLLAPFAPHMTEELYQRYYAGISNFQFPISNESSNSSINKLNGKLNSIHFQPWPEYNTEFLEEDFVEIPVQVNGKLRGTLKLSKEQAQNQQSVESAAKENNRVSTYLNEQKIAKTIFIPGKLISFVTQ